jgi:hypothetical protein
MSNLIKAIEKAAEFDDIKLVKYFEGKGDAIDYAKFAFGVRYQHAQLQWQRDALEKCVETLTLISRQHKFDEIIQRSYKSYAAQMAEERLKEIAALVPKGEM